VAVDKGGSGAGPSPAASPDFRPADGGGKARRTMVDFFLSNESRSIPMLMGPRKMRRSNKMGN